METINTENLVTSLFILGFDQVDSMLFTYTLGKLSSDDKRSRQFEFVDNETSKMFDEYVDFNGHIFKLKDGYTLDTKIRVNNCCVRLIDIFDTNRELTRHLRNVDFTEIVKKKVDQLRSITLNNKMHLFSSKEKEIMSNMISNNPLE